MSVRFKGTDLRPVLRRRWSINAVPSRSRTRACTSWPSVVSAGPMGARSSSPTPWAAIRMSMRSMTGGFDARRVRWRRLRRVLRSARWRICAYPEQRGRPRGVGHRHAPVLAGCGPNADWQLTTPHSQPPLWGRLISWRCDPLAHHRRHRRARLLPTIRTGHRDPDRSESRLPSAIKYQVQALSESRALSTRSFSIVRRGRRRCFSCSISWRPFVHTPVGRNRPDGDREGRESLVEGCAAVIGVLQK